MRLGVNLSFCVKRWVTPQLWAPVVRDALGLDLVQLSFDLVDPGWPDDLLADLAADTREQSAAYGITVHSGFIGLAHYSFNQLLDPRPKVRDAAEAWLTRAYRFAALAGIRGVGGPLGAIVSAVDGAEADGLPEADYRDLVARMRRLARCAHEAGLEELYVEPTPMRREWPWTIAQARRMMGDLEGTFVPWRLCPDWGHATFAPLYGKADARMEPWLEALAPHIGAVHLQQTDGQFDRHWDFTRQGIVDPADAALAMKRAGLADVPVFLEVFYPFEETDAAVLAAVRQSVEILKSTWAMA